MTNLPHKVLVNDSVLVNTTCCQMVRIIITRMLDATCRTPDRGRTSLLHCSLGEAGVVDGSVDYEEVPPDPVATIESLRSLGYSLESAVADLVDNSIAARAVNIEVTLHWAGGQSWLAVVDDGRGMTEDGLRQAMRIGSWDPRKVRENGDLGEIRFRAENRIVFAMRRAYCCDKIGGQ